MFLKENSDEVKWYVLSLPRASVRAKADLAAEVLRRREGSLPELEYFAPTFVDMTGEDGNKRRRQKPLLYNYVFVRSVLAEIRSFQKFHPEYNLVRSGRNNALVRYVYVPDAEMEIFMRIAHAYSDTVPCYTPSETVLCRGDKVRIIGGPFAGVEGTLLSQQGKEGDRVVVNVSNLIAIQTLTVSPEYIEILSFSKDNRHIYDKLDSYLPRIRKAMRRHLSLQPLTDDDTSAVSYFLRRMGSLEVPSLRIRAKYLSLLLMSHTVMGHVEERDHCLAECVKLLPKITSKSTLAFISVALYACTGDCAHRDKAHEIIDAWGTELSSSQKDIKSDFEAYVRMAHTKSVLA